MEKYQSTSLYAQRLHWSKDGYHPRSRALPQHCIPSYGKGADYSCTQQSVAWRSLCGFGEGVSVCQNKTTNRASIQPDPNNIYEGIWRNEEWNISQFLKILIMSLFIFLIFLKFYNKNDGSINLNKLPKILMFPHHRIRLTSKRQIHLFNPFESSFPWSSFHICRQYLIILCHSLRTSFPVNSIAN